MQQKTNDITKPDSSQKKKKLIVVLISAAFLLASLVIAFLIFKDIFSYELKHAYTADSPLYWTVGRGILNGLKPYLEMYENKPVGVFLISALSFAVTGETILCNIVSIISVMLIAFVPALALIDRYRKDENIDNLRKAAVVLTVFLSCIFLAVYTEMRSGAFQVEAIGAAFSVLFICLVYKLGRSQTKKERIILTVLASLAICCAVMLKEPFLLGAVFGALLFVDNFKDLLKNLVIPCVGGGIIAVIGLAAGGVLVPYFSIYCKRMFETRISGSRTTTVKAFEPQRIFDNVKQFSVWLLILLILFAVLALVSVIIKKKSLPAILFHVFKVAAALAAAIFSGGVARYYYSHHFIFAVPVYCAFLICGGEALCELLPKKIAVSATVFLLWGAVLVSVIPFIGCKYWGDYTVKYKALTEKAAYVDELLDFYGEDRYQFIGFNGEDVFIGSTKHSPQGPVFGQDSDNFQSADTWFSQKLLEQIDNSNIVIVKEYLSPAINEQIQNKLATSFTESPAVPFRNAPPQDFNYKVYYRIATFGLLKR